MVKMFLGNMLLILIGFCLVSCGNRSQNTVSIVVSPVTVKVCSTATLTVIAANPEQNALTVNWSAARGSVPDGNVGPQTEYVAPETGGLDTITVTIFDGSEQKTSSINVSIEEGSCTTALEEKGGIEPVPTAEPPSSTESTIISEVIPTEDPGVQTPVSEPLLDFDIAITEVMANPCGVQVASDAEDATWNEYIELYNFGIHPIDVEGWWLTDGENVAGNPDQIVAWNTRNTDSVDTTTLIFDSTVIQPGEYALILPPSHFEARDSYRTPYIFPPGTTLLTISSGELLGSDDKGLEVSQFLNSVVLYVGSEETVERVVSTYGSPQISANPKNIELGNDGDGIPYFLRDCVSAERLDPKGGDVPGNWGRLDNGSPGSSSQ